jgi:hypothetical protein
MFDLKCVNCPSGCEVCSDPRSCAKCADKYYAISSGCASCPSGCATCYFNN